MQNSCDFIAMATGLVAIWYTIRESRRNNGVHLKIIECRATGNQSVHENNSNFFHEFGVIIRNCGIPLHQVRANISFREPDGGYGRFNLPLFRRERSGDRDEFAKGMIVEFGFKSYEMDKFSINFLRLLRDPRSQDAYLCIFSQNYLAAEFRIGGFGDRANSVWNRCMYRYNQILERHFGDEEESHKVLRARLSANMRPVLRQQISHFRKWTLDELENDKKTSA